ncbi:MAG: DinB family protein [Bacteroidota bacterium]
MNESPQQYAARISSYVAGKNFLQQIQKSPRRIAALLRGKRPPQLNKRPSPERWSVAEVLAHLTEAEIAYGYRIRLIAGAPGTPIQAFNQDKWQVHARYLQRNPKQTAVFFESLRLLNVLFIKSLPPDALDRFGIHEERGHESIRRLTELMAGHDENHIRQLAAILKPGRKAPE